MSKAKEHPEQFYPIVNGARDWDNPTWRKTWRFMCPGCGFYHAFEEGRWTFNGNFDKPTFSPSLLLKESDGWKYQCHSFVRDGRIEFLSDCTHALVGQTVDLPELETKTPQN